MKQIKKAWIQGNIISFEKPKHKSVFFDCEEVLVLKLKSTKSKLSKENIRFIESILTKQK